MKTHSVGIDLGTTRSVIAFLDAAGRPTTIENSEGGLTTPSAVFFDGDVPIVGREAIKIAEFEPDRIAAFAKRSLGRTDGDLKIGSHRVPPEVIQGIILRRLKDDAALKLGQLGSVVVTVPAYFNEARRKATQDAGRLAGLDVADIINEPTAAALAYGVQRGFVNAEGRAEQKESVLVYDLGGGTFDVTLMDIHGDDYTTIATAGDVHLGGIDWDQQISNFIAQRWTEEFGLNLNDSPIAQRQLWVAAEDAKQSLTMRQSTVIRFNHDGRQLRFELSRLDFESMTAALVDRTMLTTRRLLLDSKRQWSDVTRLLLVGGSSRMPMIQEMLTAESGLQPDRSLSPDESVAHGAAVFAGIVGRNENVRNLTVSNVNSHDLGVLGIDAETGENRVAVMIPRNTRLPARAAKRFHTFQDNQTSVGVKVVEGGDTSGNHSTPVGNCVVTPLPANLPKTTPIDVLFEYGTDGRLQVVARLPETKTETALTIERARGLDEAQLQEWTRRIDSDSVLAAPMQQTEPPRSNLSLPAANAATDSPTAHRTPTQPTKQQPEPNSGAAPPGEVPSETGWKSRRKRVTAGDE